MNLLLLFAFLSIFSHRVTPVCFKKTSTATPETPTTTTADANNQVATSKNSIFTTLMTTTTMYELPVLIASK